MKLLLAFLISNFLFAFSFPLKDIDHQDALSVVCEWEHKNKLTPLEMPNDEFHPFNHLSRTYRIFLKCDISQARKLILEYSESLLSRINSTPQIRPDLVKYPFTADQLSLSIRLIDENTDSFAELPSVAMVALVKGKIFYVGTKCPSSPLTNIAEESYEEALKLVNHQAGK